MMRWEDFLNSILSPKQIEILRAALKINAHVHFYGQGLGKSTIADTLKSMGFNVTEAADYCEGPYGQASMSVADGTEAICFNVKKEAPKNLVPQLYKILESQKDEIIQWVNS